MKKITLCGSTKFKQAFLDYNKKLTLEGNVVYSVAFFGHADNTPLTAEQKQLLDNVHLEKINLSDEIFVLDVNGYIGESTKREINLAEFLNKKVRYLSIENKENNIYGNEHFPECVNTGKCKSICALCYE